MESSGIQTLYERSEESFNLRYNPYIGDGDSSSYSNIDRTRPYGQAFFVEKDECVGHVTKRMGTGLREIIKSEKGNYLFQFLFDISIVCTNDLIFLKNIYQWHS